MVMVMVMVMVMMMMMMMMIKHEEEDDDDDEEEEEEDDDDDDDAGDDDEEDDEAEEEDDDVVKLHTMRHSINPQSQNIFFVFSTPATNNLQVDARVAEQSAKAKVSEFAFDCAMDSTDPKAYNYVSQEQTLVVLRRSGF